MKDGDVFVIVRTKDYEVYAGYCTKRKDQEVVLIDAFQIESHTGRSSLLDLATLGATPHCKFSMFIEWMTVFEVVLVLEVSEEAEKSLKNHPHPLYGEELKREEEE